MVKDTSISLIQNDPTCEHCEGGHYFSMRYMHFEHVDPPLIEIATETSLELPEEIMMDIFALLEVPYLLEIGFRPALYIKQPHKSTQPNDTK